ncbi:MAG: hypothetical protein AAF696_36870 [Bacteroidota bacterium]
MKYRFICILFLYSFLFSTYAGMAQKYFEGIITYEVETKLKYEEHEYNYYFEQKYGDSLKVYIFKDGSFRREYMNSGKLGLDWQIYNRSNNNYYAKYRSLDTVYYYDTKENVFEFKSFNQLPNRIILGKTCEGLEKVIYEPRAGETFISHFYYSGEEALAPNIYDEFKDGYWDQAFKKIQSQVLAFSTETPYLLMYSEAVKIEWKKLDKSILKLPEEVPLKYN